MPSKIKLKKIPVWLLAFYHILSEHHGSVGYETESTALNTKECWGLLHLTPQLRMSRGSARTVCPPHKCIHVPYNFFGPDCAVALHPPDICKIPRLWFALPMQAVWCWVKPGGHLQVNPPRVLTQRNWQLCCLVWHSSRSETTEKSRRISGAVQLWIMWSHESTGTVRFLRGHLV